MTRKKVCIIGAGIGGLAAGMLLIKKGYRVTIFEKESKIGGRAISFEGSSINLQDYKKLLSRFNMDIAFSEPNLDKIFKNKLLKNYILDLGFHIISGQVPLNIKSFLAETDEYIEFLDSFIGFIEKDSYRFPFITKLDKIKIFPNIFRLLSANEKTLDKLEIIDVLLLCGVNQPFS